MEGTTEEQGGIVRMLERAGSIGAWRLDLRTRDLGWSDQLARIHGHEPGYVPEDPLQHYATDCRDKLAGLLRACESEGVTFDEEAQIVLPDGRRAWVRALGEPVRDASGAIVA